MRRVGSTKTPALEKQRRAGVVRFDAQCTRGHCRPPQKARTAAHAVTIDPPFSWRNPYPSVRTPVFARNAIATSHPLAVSAGLRMMARGGNAIDAAIAGAAVIALAEPCSNGLGSDLFALVWAKGKLHGLNASGPAPAAWSRQYFAQRYGEECEATRPVRGWDTVTVPGAVAGWAALQGRLGRLEFEEVLAPAIEYADRGFALSPITQDKWQKGAPLLAGQPGFDEHFLPFGRVPEIGQRVTIPGAARTLRSIARTRGESFYRGEIAEAIAQFAEATGGALTVADLAGYAPRWVDPIAGAFHGHELHQIPPNGQGIAALMCLGILRHTDLADYRVDSADWYHVGIEAMKIAFADVYAHVSDPASMRVDAAQLLDDEYLRERARRIDMRRAQSWHCGIAPRGGTIYLSAADEQGKWIMTISAPVYNGDLRGEEDFLGVVGVSFQLSLIHI